MISCKIIDTYKLLLQKRFQRNVRRSKTPQISNLDPLYISSLIVISPLGKKRKKKKWQSTFVARKKETQQEAKVSFKGRIWFSVALNCTGIFCVWNADGLVIGRIADDCKVHIFWEGYKILPNLHLTFDCHYIGQK